MIGTGNRFAHAAALAVAELPGQAYNPLFVCGPPGVGKTHLLQAIGNYMSLCVSSLTVRYATAETFTSQFLDALQRNQIPSFKQRYRPRRAAARRRPVPREQGATAEEFLYTIEAALNAGAQVVLSADRPPSAMPLLARSAEGPLRGRAARRPRSRPTMPHAARDPAQAGRAGRRRARPPRRPRAARAAGRRQRPLARERAGPRPRLCLPHPAALTLELAEHVLGRNRAPSGRIGRPAGPSIERIQDGTSRALEVEPDTLTSARRSRQVVYARQVAMYLCRELTDHSLPAIAQRFGGRDHTTVLHAHRKVQRAAARRPTHTGSLWTASCASSKDALSPHAPHRPPHSAPSQATTSRLAAAARVCTQNSHPYSSSICIMSVAE